MTIYLALLLILLTLIKTKYILYIFSRQWTIQNLMDRVGDNEVLIRGKTNHEDYKLGKVNI